MPAIRVLVWNVHGFRAGVRRMAAAIEAEAPDVVLLNEARFRWRLRRFAALMGMSAVSGLRWPGPVTNAVLARAPWRIVEHSRAALTRTRRLKRRGVVVAKLRRAGQPLLAVCVHLGVSDPERVRHARELTDILAGAPPPIVLGGDLNEDPGHPAASWIAERYWDAFARAGEGPAETFPSHAPRARIDYLFVSDGVEVTGCRVLRDPEIVAMSDHLPVVAEVELPD